ncbi:MAG: DUF2382 domain-containing protein [Cyanobacteria bacterium J06634_6]
MEEKAVVSKKVFVREEVSVRKETEQEMVSERATVRREELDVDTSKNVQQVVDRQFLPISVLSR